MLHVVNNHIVKPIPLPHLSNLPVKGGEICPKAYGPIFALAKRESGKTSVAAHILKHCTSPKTHIIVFCSTLYNDDNWIQIRKWLAKRGNPTDYFLSTKEDGEDQIKRLYDEFTEEAKAREDGENEDDDDMIAKTDQIFAHLNKNKNKNKNKKKKKEKFLTPKYVIIFDDISHELKSTWLVKLLKESRHFLAKVIISSQYIHDMKPESLTQIDLWLIFKGLPEEKLETIHQRTDLTIPFDQFWQAYKLATTVTKKETHPFLYLDVRKNELRRNFNRKIILPKQDEEDDQE